MQFSMNWLSYTTMILIYSSTAVFTKADEGELALPYLKLMEDLSGGLRTFQEEDLKFRDQEPSDMTPEDKSEYDFIVIGAGTAGAAVAARLSENPNWTILLIEAGGSESLWMDIPLGSGFLPSNPNLNWIGNTPSSASFCFGKSNGPCTWPRGKVMGGSSVLNNMIATRGNRRDYDHWAKLGNEGWSWKDVLPYFKKLETMGVEQLKNDKAYHNFDGPVHINSVSSRTPLATAFLEAGAELGYKNVDHNGKSNMGFSYVQATINKGTRMSSNKAYLHPAKGRANLYVTKNSYVTKIMVSKKLNQAFGVRIRKLRDIRVLAKKEVILCAGAIGSPHLLMLSGIGPKQHLKEVGIPLVVDLPVGENFQNHLAYSILPFVIDEPLAMSVYDMVYPNLLELREFFMDRTGPMASPGRTEAIGFINVDNPNDPEEYPNIEIILVTCAVSGGANFGEDPKLYRNITNANTWGALPVLMRPKSRGRILLRDNKFRHPPKVQQNKLEHPEDVKTLVKGIKIILKLGSTKAMKKFGSTFVDTQIPGCTHLENYSDEYWDCAVRKSSIYTQHYSGTCKMGPEDDSGAVVNPKLQVKGVKGLRVADASIMPEIITGHTNIPTFMIAEKLADMVKQHWGYPTDPLP